MAAYVLIVVVMAFGLWRVETTANRAEETADRLDAETELNDAQRCVNAWEGREDTRDMAEAGYRRNAETLLSFAGDSPRAQEYREQVERDVVEIRAALPDPECSLEAAERRLEDG